MGQQHEVSFTVTAAERRLIDQIVSRAMGALAQTRDRATRLDVTMDITATHANGNPLRLADLLGADDFNFAHDIFGIRTHLDRETGRLMDFFVPRFSRPEKVAA